MVVDCSDDLTETVDLYIEVLVSSLKLVNLSLVSFLESLESSDVCLESSVNSLDLVRE